MAADIVQSTNFRPKERKISAEFRIFSNLPSISTYFVVKASPVPSQYHARSALVLCVNSQCVDTYFAVSCIGKIFKKVGNHSTQLSSMQECISDVQNQKSDDWGRQRICVCR